MPARRLVNALKKEKIYIGRVWPSWPTHARVTVGTRDEMAKFKLAIVKALNEAHAGRQSDAPTAAEEEEEDIRLD
jgi:histidinol-phosphate/aromatic aminotransferase/cobyric acid decarboxylase-like protein